MMIPCTIVQLSLSHILLSHAQVPQFTTVICAAMRTALRTQLVSIEAENMSGFERNGDDFEKYFKRWDLQTHLITTSKDEVLGFAICGSEGRGKVFLYELHVKSGHRHRGLATALLSLCERSSTARGRTSPLLELQVHAANKEALSFYTHAGFVQMGVAGDGDVLVLQRKR